jgi:hypothetical protein
MPRSSSDWRFLTLDWEQCQSLILALVVVGIIVVPQWLFSLVEVPDRTRTPLLAATRKGTHAHAHTHAHGHRFNPLTRQRRRDAGETEKEGETYDDDDDSDDPTDGPKEQ